MARQPRPHHRALLTLAALCASAIARPAAADDDALAEWMSRHGQVASPSRPAAAAPARPHDAGGELVIAALNFLDRPYRRGGDNLETGFDCSGFTRHLFGQTLGIELPRRVDDQAHAGALRKVSPRSLRAGDLVFFNTLRRTFSHVGLYLGDGRFIHAPRSGAKIRVESLATAYWARRLTGVRRAAGLDEPAAARAAAPVR